MTDTVTDTADARVKARHRAMWASGDYPQVADVVIPRLGPRVVEAAGIGPGDRVIDIAAGSGNASIPAARTGAEVVATDLTPELLDAGRARARAEGVEIEWRVADAEALPFDDGAFDVAISTVGIMFAPHHADAAREALRVVRPGGRIVLANWTPAGFIGRMFGILKPYAPPPPPGAQPPPKWGDPEHVAGLFGSDVRDVATATERLTVDCFRTGEDFREFFKSAYGPTISVYAAIADDPEAIRTLDSELSALAGSADLGGGRMEWEYLLWSGTRI